MQENFKQLAEYLEQIKSLREQYKPDNWNYHYLCNEDFVLQEGKFFEPNKNIKPYKLMTIKLCFKNAFQIMDRYGLRYIEGYATTGIIPMLHAWNLTDDDKVIDVTWRFNDKYSPLAYVGVEFNKDLIYKTLINKRTYGILDNWEDRFPHLKEKFQ
jgi:hypothetical protein